MASLLKKAMAAVAATRTTVLTAATAKQTIIINGLISNIHASKATYFVTIEVGTGATYRTLLKDAPIPYGGALELPKVVLEAGDLFCITGSAASAMEVFISYVEKD